MSTGGVICILAWLLATGAGVAEAQQAVILVRHAELAGAAMAPPQDVPLSDAGQARAARLASLLKDAGITAIYTTEFLRTQQTAAPLAQALQLAITEIPKGPPDSLVARLRQEHRQEQVLLVGHSDTLPGLLKALGYPDALQIAPQDFSNVFVLVPHSDSPPTLLRLRY